MSQPWMPLYVADYLADTRRLSTLEHGAYLLLIMEYWRNGSLPDDDRKLARIVGLSVDEWAEMRPTLEEFFEPGWRHVRIDAEAAKAQNRSENAKAKALLRHSHGNAAAEPQQSRSNARGRPSQPQSQEEPNGSSNSDSDESLVDGGAADAGEVETNVVKIARKPPAAGKSEAIRATGEWWNDLASQLGLRQIDAIKPGSSREAHTWARCRELAVEFGGLSAGLAAMEGKIRGSPFLTGQVSSFRATFDWVTNATNFQKIIEGNYENSQARQRQQR